MPSPPDNPAATPTAAKRRWWQRLWPWMRAPLVAFILLCLLMMWLENSLIYFPARHPEGWWEPDGLVFEDAHFESADGTKLHGWYVPVDDPQAVILFCHGNAGNVTHRYELMRGMQLYTGASVLVFDYRGYGKSEGTPHEAGVLADARAARAWLANRARVPEQEIVLMGESIGAAVAVDLAGRDGARGLVLENAFTSLPDVAAYHYPWLPVRWLMRGKLDSLTQIRSYHGPLLMFHGDADSIVPYRFGKKLFEAANQPKRFVTVPGADHNDGRTARFYDDVQRFLEELPPPQGYSAGSLD